MRLAEEIYLSGQSALLVARRHELNAKQLFTWRHLMERGALAADGAGERVGPAFACAQLQICEIHLQLLLPRSAADPAALRNSL